MTDQVRPAAGADAGAEPDYRVALEHMEDAIHFVGPDLRFVMVNETLRRWNRQLGLAEDVAGRHLGDVYPFLPESAFAQYATVLATGRTLITEERSVVAGRVILTHTQKIPISDGATVTGVITVIRDVTAVRRAESDRRRLTAILESTSDLVATATPEGRIIFINEAGLRLLGWTAAGGVGRYRIADAHPEWAVRVVTEQAVPAAQAGGLWIGETAVLGPDGREVPVSQVLMAHRGADGGLEYLSTIIRDISESKRNEERVRTLNAELEERVRLRTAELEAAQRELESFNYSVSHDLRAPLRTIDAFAAALDEDCPDGLGPAGRDHLGRIRRAAARMAGLIDDLLRLSRVTVRSMEPEEIDLSALAAAIAADLRAATPERRIEFAMAPGAHARGDAALLRIALENLLGNAVKYTGRRPEARIEFGVQPGDPPAFFVRDDGAGFDMAHVGSLFAPFSRLHHEDEFPGSGIGLSIVQRIVLRHGGRVWAEGREGAGATFYFTLGRQDSTRGTGDSALGR